MSAASKSPNVMKIENGSQGRLTQISRFSYQNNDICDQNFGKELNHLFSSLHGHLVN